MDQSELVSAVRSTAGTLTYEDAEQALHATLHVLGDRLDGGETQDLASQLPPAFAADLPATGKGERFGLEEFYRRVAELQPGEHTPQEARRQARAVAAALKACLTGVEFDQVAGQLPQDYDDLLGTGPVQH